MKFDEQLVEERMPQLAESHEARVDLDARLRRAIEAREQDEDVILRQNPIQ